MTSLLVTVSATVPIVMSGAGATITDLGVVSWTDPAVLKINNYAPEVSYLDGSTALSWRRPQTLLNWSVAPFGAADETEADALIAALDAAISGIGFTVTREKNGVTKVWRCDAGSVTPSGETTKQTLDSPSFAVWNVSIPCFPVPVS